MKGMIIGQDHQRTIWGGAWDSFGEYFWEVYKDGVLMIYPDGTHIYDYTKLAGLVDTLTELHLKDLNEGTYLDWEERDRSVTMMMELNKIRRDRRSYTRKK